MNSEGLNSKFFTNNEDLGLFLPNSLIPEVLTDYDFKPSKNLIKYCFGGESNDSDITCEDSRIYAQPDNYNPTQNMNSRGGLFNPRGKCYSHQQVNANGFQNRQNFGNMNQMPQFNQAWGNNNNNNNFYNFNNFFSNNNGSSMNMNNFSNMPNQNFPASIKNGFTPSSSNRKFSKHSNSGVKMGNESTEYSSNQDSFNNNVLHSLENSMGSLNLNRPRKKNFSTENVLNFKSKYILNNKKNMFNNKKSQEEEEDLETFLENLECDLHVFICSQKGSRIMQKFLNKITPENLNLFIDRIGYNIPGLMINLYGNYFCQKLVQSCSAEQRILILNYTSKEIVNISYDNSGTHALQSLLEIINLPEEEMIILNAIKNFALDMSFNNNATHVIQKIIVCVSEERRDFLNKIIIDNIKNLCLDSNGICVVKKLINTNKSEIIKHKVIEEILFNCLEIVQSPFGNYAIQHLLEEWGILYCKNLINVIKTNIISLSMQKYSSNVVERCLEMSDKEIQRAMINDIMNPSKLLSLLKNKYGSFVLQKAVNYLTLGERIEMRIFLQNKTNITSSKEKSRINAFFELLSN